MERRRVSFLIVSAAGWKILDVGIVVGLLGDHPKPTGDPFPLHPVCLSGLLFI